MVVCPACGEENPDRARFCLNCATALRDSQVQEERKVVTVLFCDLVGFTARSDRADPEDVKDRLRPFHARLKREIEAYGGTLDKFIGDAALGVFGSPLAHEDDPERAVRAGLSMLTGIADLNAERPDLELAVRVGIETGEAIVHHDAAGPKIGEAVTGDVVNTASRLQGQAPVNGVIVGEATYRATREAIAYEELGPVAVKGKADPLPVWLALEPRRRLGGGRAAGYATPFVGRRAEIDALQKAFEMSMRGRTVRMVAIVGEAGAGKSRLVAELKLRAEAANANLLWRAGRCLPYGEGITFWALGEIVKAHAGILESDAPEVAAAKLDGAIPPEDVDREWLRRRLAPLVGLEGLPADRDESFTAWRRFLESIAAQAPAVLVFEDLHWADGAMLDFLEHLAGQAGAVPMLVLGTARPELLERAPGWGEWDRGVVVDLDPLSLDETAEVVSSLLDGSELPEAVRSLVLEQAGGNPLYAEEFARMLRDRRLTGDAASLESEYPESVQGLIAARLDTVSRAHKAVLQDASVLGRAFWAAAVAAMQQRGEPETLDALGNLSRRELVRPDEPSSIEGQAEFSFWHALVRDVAYGQIPRAARAAKHGGAAAWIEEAAGARVEDNAEILAYHYTEALTLARAARLSELVAELESPALRFLLAAGDRALGLDVARAETHFARALELAPPGHEMRPRVLVRWADAARQAGRSREAVEVLHEAVRLFLQQPDRHAAARALNVLSTVFHNTGDPRQEEVAVQAVELLEGEPPGPDLVAAYTRVAGVNLVLGRNRRSIEWAERAVALSAHLAMEPPPTALGFMGFSRAALGDARGLEEARAALGLALEQGQGRDAAVLYNNLAVAVHPIEGPRAAIAILGEGIEFSERRGIAEMASAMEAGSLDLLVDLGEWDQALELASLVGERAEGGGEAADLIQVRWVQTRLLAHRGEVETAVRLAEWLEAAAAESGATEDLIACHAAAAVAYLESGEPQLACDLLARVDESAHARENPAFPPWLGEMVRAAVGAGDVDLAQRLSEGVELRYPYLEHASRAANGILAEARGDMEGAAKGYAEAASRWEGFGVVPERAHALLGLGRSRLASERPAEAAEPLREALRLFSGLRASPREEEARVLLSRVPGS